MNASAEMQFMQALLNPERPVPQLLRTEDSRNFGVSRHVEQRFNVYRNNVVSGLIEALVAGFPITLQLLGDEYFRAVTALFVRKHPPTTPVLLEYGAEFSAFLKSFPPLNDVPYIADIAKLEWHRRVAFHSADAMAIGVAHLQASAPNNLLRQSIGVHPAVQIVYSEHPLLQLWNSQQWHAPIPTAEQWHSEIVLISRPALQLQMQCIDPAQAQLIEELRGGASLAEAFTSIAAEPVVAGAMFIDLLQSGIFLHAAV